MAICCAARAPPSRLGELLAERPEIRAPAHPRALPVSRRRAAPVRACHLPLSDPARGRRARRFHARRGGRRDGRDRRARRARASRRCSSSPSASTIRRPGACCSTACRCTDADPAAIRARIAMVPQETVIFAASARDNLRYGRWDADDDELWAAAEAANAADFLQRAARGARHLPRRGRRAPVGRPAPAHRDRPRAAARRADPAARRSDQRARRRERAAGAGCARPADGGPHHAGHRPPPRHRARGRPHRRDGEGPHRRAGHPRRSCSPAAASTRGSPSCSSKRRAEFHPPQHAGRGRRRSRWWWGRGAAHSPPPACGRSPSPFRGRMIRGDRFPGSAPAGRAPGWRASPPTSRDDRARSYRPAGRKGASP